MLLTLTFVKFIIPLDDLLEVSTGPRCPWLTLLSPVWPQVSTWLGGPKSSWYNPLLLDDLRLALNYTYCRCVRKASVKHSKQHLSWKLGERSSSSGVLEVDVPSLPSFRWLKMDVGSPMEVPTHQNLCTQKSSQVEFLRLHFFHLCWCRTSSSPGKNTRLGNVETHSAVPTTAGRLSPGFAV